MSVYENRQMPAGNSYKFVSCTKKIISQFVNKALVIGCVKLFHNFT